MADADQDQKTEQPTAKKLADARGKGQVASVPEMRHATAFVGVILVAGGMGSWTLARLGTMFVKLWGQADDYARTPDATRDLIVGVAEHVAIAIAPLAVTLFGLALLPLFLQGRPTLNSSRLALKWSSLSPAAGAARLFGKKALVEFAKTLAKLIVVVVIAVLVLRPHLVALDALAGASPIDIAHSASTLIYQLVRAIALLVALLAGADFAYQHRAFIRRLRMTRQEVQDEHRQSEGDPHIKARIRSIRMARGRKRMMAAVPTASVIVTNPTHYAVALKYEHGVMAAPIVVAKGMNAVALRIRAIATDAGVPIVESPPLARALHASAEVEHPIPVEHYAAVAEIISYVMRLSRQLN